MQLFIIPLIALAACLVTFCYYHFRKKAINAFSYIVPLLIFLLCLLSRILIPVPSSWHWQILQLSQLNLSVCFYYDNLSWIMLSLVSFISLIIQSYSERYLRSDANQPRFMGQLSLLTFSVILLIISGSLMTAFFAWQFIGLSLYLLLNHYHYDVKANKAAKKKFMINQLGDICFLLAVIVAIHDYGTTEFVSLFRQAGNIDSSILMLIFIAVMTKSAQFPFHIWLIDTMEAPTPVSALMHAGVINAGGFLLARLSPLYIVNSEIMLAIFAIGLLTALLGNYFMRTQPDVKKQLAYSTMGQMGYMVTQCGVGSFASAVFHLITHGFFKASLFLSSGSTLKQHNQAAQHNPDRNQLTQYSIASFFITLVMLAGGYAALQYYTVSFNLNPLIWFFTAITLFSLNKQGFIQCRHSKTRIMSSLLIILLYIVYLAAIYHFNLLLDNSIKEPSINLSTPMMLSLVTAALLIFVFSKSLRKTIYKSRFITVINFYPDKVEQFYRRFLLKPVRSLGDVMLNAYLKFSGKKIILAGFILANVLPIIYDIFISQQNISHYNPLILLNVVSMTVLLLISNRMTGLLKLSRSIPLYIIVLTTITLSSGYHDRFAITLFQLLNNLAIIFGFFLLLSKRSEQQATSTTLSSNKLPFCHFYISLFLILLIGAPGTASFITEFYLLDYFSNVSLLLAMFFGANMLLLTLVILHTLQIHFFNPNAIKKHAVELSVPIHISSLLLIGFNIFNGIFPSFLLNTLTRLIGE